MKSYEEMVVLFENANKEFLQNDIGLLYNDVAERTLCGALMYHLRKSIDGKPGYKGYFADVEYNRSGRQVKTRLNDDLTTATINCDLILHSRGLHTDQDNLIALEMKKSHRPPEEKFEDKKRLIALTRTQEDEFWAYGKNTLPEHVCGYILGVYYEIDCSKEEVKIEYYKRGQCCKSYVLSFE